MTHKDVYQLVNRWIMNDKKTNTNWTVRKSTKEPETVIVSGTIIKKIEQYETLIKVSCSTNNDSDSIGKALQAMNDIILSKL